MQSPQSLLIGAALLYLAQYAGAGNPSDCFVGAVPAEFAQSRRGLLTWETIWGEPTLRHGDYIQAVAWSRDGKRLCSCGDDGLVRVWDTASWRLLGRWQEALPVCSAVIEGDLVIAASECG